MKTPVEKYIKIVDLPSKTKTKQYGVLNERSGYVVGIIKWHGAWRKYCYFPHDDTLYDPQCLIYIATFVQKQTTIHMQQRKSVKGVT